ncbi:MAG: hypothetical protein LBB58_03655 [Cellulomonadaceae bacterium]|jgi:hypothetical protein|nr:hypothetical protein [Cellulomonadaceae bacterium]
MEWVLFYLLVSGSSLPIVSIVVGIVLIAVVCLLRLIPTPARRREEACCIAIKAAELNAKAKERARLDRLNAQAQARVAKNNAYLDSILAAIKEDDLEKLRTL